MVKVQYCTETFFGAYCVILHVNCRDILSNLAKSQALNGSMNSQENTRILRACKTMQDL